MLLNLLKKIFNSQYFLRSRIRGWFYGFFLRYKGKEVYIADNTYLYAMEKISIGERTGIMHNCDIYGLGGISIGKDVMIAPYCKIISSNHNFSDPDLSMNQQGYTSEPIKIEDNCWIGAGAIILAGVTIGQGAVVGAGSIVTKDVLPYTIVAGNPAKLIKERKTRK